jgi:hypothetical protein
LQPPAFRPFCPEKTRSIRLFIREFAPPTRNFQPFQASDVLFFLIDEKIEYHAPTACAQACDLKSLQAAVELIPSPLVRRN